MSIESAKVLYFGDDWSEVRVAVGTRRGHSPLPMKAVAFPRSKMDLVRDVGETDDENSEDVPSIAEHGVYILFGQDELEKNRAYIGHAESVYKRLSDHRSNSLRNWWTDTVVFVATKDGGLDIAHMKQIESCLIQSAKKANHQGIIEQTKPSKDAGKLSPRDRRNTSELAADLEIIANALGWDLFRKAYSDNEANAVSGVAKLRDGQGKPPFYFKGRGFSAEMQINNSGKFVIEKGSKARIEDMKELAAGIIREREKLKENKMLLESNGYLVFQKDYCFDYISRSASVVSGQNRNGNTAWKTSDGRTYEQWLRDNERDNNKDGVSVKPSVPSRSPSREWAWKSPEFIYSGNRGKDFYAKMQIKSRKVMDAEEEKYVVKKDSRASMQTSSSTGKGVVKLREDLRNEGVLDQDFVFTQDYDFSSASMSASVVRGHNKNGNDAWKIPGDRTLGQWRSDQKQKSRKRGSKSNS